jgi:hypothetical protein
MLHICCYTEVCFLLPVLIFQKNIEVEKEMERELERDTVSEYVMMSDDDDDDSDTGGADVEVNMMLI